MFDNERKIIQLHLSLSGTKSENNDWFFVAQTKKLKTSINEKYYLGRVSATSVVW